MTARSISSLTVTFGLVAIPVKLYTATSSKSISFNLLHKGCGSRLKQQYLCAKEGVVVPSDDIVRLRIRQGAVRDVHPRRAQGAGGGWLACGGDHEFVPIESVDPDLLRQAYYLAPDKGGAKPYALFAQALHDSKRCALGRWASHGKQHIVMPAPLRSGAGHAAIAVRRRSAGDR